jgi:hypothetical protein
VRRYVPTRTYSREVDAAFEREVDAVTSDDGIA